MTVWSRNPYDSVIPARPRSFRRIFIKSLPVAATFSISVLVGLKLAGGMQQTAKPIIPLHPAPVHALQSAASPTGVPHAGATGYNVKSYGALFGLDGSLIGVPVVSAKNEPFRPTLSSPALFTMVDPIGTPIRNPEVETPPLFVMIDPLGNPIQNAVDEAPPLFTMIDPIGTPTQTAEAETPPLFVMIDPIGNPIRSAEAETPRQAAEQASAEQAGASSEPKVVGIEPDVPAPPSRPAQISVEPRIAELSVQPRRSENISPRRQESVSPRRDPALASVGEQAAKNTENDPRNFFEKIFGAQDSNGSQLAYASPEGNSFNPFRGMTSTPSPVKLSAGTAIYDISAHTVYLPNGQALEAHSGLGVFFDDPDHVNVRMRGATPPAVYDLTLRESLFHGVQALRLTPISGSTYGRSGLLAHTFMLGQRGDSNGCVSFRDYHAFLQAYMNGEVRRLVVVPRRIASAN